MREAKFQIADAQQKLILIDNKRIEISTLLKQRKVKLLSDKIIFNEFVYGYSFIVDLVMSEIVVDHAFEPILTGWDIKHGQIQVMPKKTLGVYTITQRMDINEI